MLVYRIEKQRAHICCETENDVAVLHHAMKVAKNNLPTRKNSSARLYADIIQRDLARIMRRFGIKAFTRSNGYV